MILYGVLVPVFMLACNSVLCSLLPNGNTINFGRNKRSLPFDPSQQLENISSVNKEKQNSTDKCFSIEGTCDPSAKYRTFDGSCNNLVRPALGTPNTPVVRLLAPSYADGKSQFRLAQDGNPLPSPRLVRTTVLPDGDTIDQKLTLGVMSWGQMIAHDVALRALEKHPGDPQNCCNPDGSLNPHPACVPISIPPNDPFFSKFNQTCLDLKRVSVYNKTGCMSSAVQQLSAVTHYMDGSFIYGLNKEKSDELRLFRGGLLKTQTNKAGRPFLINVKKPTQVCDVPRDTDVCYLSGDPDRVNLNTEIAASQVMFMRLHNLLAGILQFGHHDWSDEIIYQETRRIVIAFVQHITYNEYLPALLGSEFVKEHNLSPQESGYAKGYDPSVNPSSISEFVAGAFRYFHSTISGHPNLIKEDRNISGTIRLSNHTNNPGVIQESNNFDYFLRGLITQPEDKTDPFFTDEITNYFSRNKTRFPLQFNGTDLISIDINRGREYGVPPYTSVRTLCGLPAVNGFDDLKDVMDVEKIELLKKVYSSVHDIDYFVGGSLEKKYPGSLASKSFQCVVAKAFFRYKFGDRFFYEFGGHPGAFTLEQLDAIRKFSYSKLVCLTSDGIQQAQPSGFKVVDSATNPLKNCSELLEAFTFKAWA